MAEELPESMRRALIAMHRYGRTCVPFGTNILYGPVMAPATAYGLERRGLAAVTPASSTRLGGARQGEVRFTDAGRELAAELDQQARAREVARFRALELSPPRRGHLTVVDGGLPPSAPSPNMRTYCAHCRRRIHKQRNDEWYHNHNASRSCRPGWTANRATPGNWRPV